MWYGSQYIKTSYTPPLLDTVTGALAAFSTTRNLKTGVTDIVKIRRSTGGEDLFTAAEIAASDDLTYVGSGDGFYTEIIDQSGNGRSLLQATTANQPKVINAGSRVTSNGKPCIKTIGANTKMTSAAFSAATGSRSYAVVFEIVNEGGLNNTVFEHKGTGYLDAQRNGIGKFFSGSGVNGMVANNSTAQRTAIQAITLNTKIILEMYVLANNYIKMYINGSLVQNMTTLTIASETTARELWIGGNGASNTTQEINILEAIYWEGDKSADRSTIYSNLSTYYA